MPSIQPQSIPIKETSINQPVSPTNMSPNLLTPEMDQIHEVFTFPKQAIKSPNLAPVSPLSANTQVTAGFISPFTSDSEAGAFVSEGDGGERPQQQHLSLLTALLHSPEHRQQTVNNAKKSPNAPSHNGGLTSALSSVPSTAFSSPNGRSQGILQQSGATLPPVHPMSNDQPTQPVTSILRRASTDASSDGGRDQEVMGLGLSLMSTMPAINDDAAPVQIQLPQAQEVPLQRAPSGRATCLKFAMAKLPSAASSDSGEALSRRTSLHRATSRSSSGSRRPSSPFAKERALQGTVLPPTARKDSSENVDDDQEEVEQEQDAEEDEGDSMESDLSDAERKLPGYQPSRASQDVNPEDDEDTYQDLEDSDSDEGYQEDDEEDDSPSDEDEVAGIFSNSLSNIPNAATQFPFARSTNYRTRRRKGDGHPSHPQDGLSRSPSPTPAPAVLPPPVRRGRGHIRVLEDPTSGKEGKERCSRHVSPPPSARSRSGSANLTLDTNIQMTSSNIIAPPAAASPSARKLSLKRSGRNIKPYTPLELPTRNLEAGRLSDAGPRDGRAGSPMPPTLDIESESESDDEDEDDEIDEDVQEDEDQETGDGDHPTPVKTHPPKTRSGWRSDDSMFYGPDSQQTRGILPIRLDAMTRNISAPPDRAVFSESDDEEQQHSQAGNKNISRRPSAAMMIPQSVPMEASTSNSGVGENVRNFLRRASEHLPLFGGASGSRRPSMIGPTDTIEGQNPSTSTSVGPKVIPPHSAPLLSQATCPPALDDTPALGVSVSARNPESRNPSPVTERLEKVLSSGIATSAGSHVNANGGPAQTISKNSVGGLHRASTISSGKVTFGSTPPDFPQHHNQHYDRHFRTSGSTLAPAPIIRSPPTQAVSGDEGARRKGDLGFRIEAIQQYAGQDGKAQGQKSKPIACPVPCSREEDHGWSEQALRRIRKNGTAGGGGRGAISDY